MFKTLLNFMVVISATFAASANAGTTICGEVFVTRTVLPTTNAQKYLIPDDGSARWAIMITMPNIRETQETIELRQAIVDSLRDAESVCLTGLVYERMLGPNEVEFKN